MVTLIVFSHRNSSFIELPTKEKQPYLLINKEIHIDRINY